MLVFSVLYWYAYIAPLFVSEGVFFFYSLECLLLAFFASVLCFIRCDDQKDASIFYFMFLHASYVCVSSICLGQVSFYYYIWEAALSIVLFIWVITRREIRQGEYDTRNVLLAFYKGRKGSFLMNVGSLFGFNVKSMSVILNDECLRLKSSISEFVVTPSAPVLKSKNYIIVDTKVPITDLHKGAADATKGRSAYTFWLFRANCIRGLYPFLCLLGEKYRPSVWLHYIPSVYLRYVLKG